MQTVTQWYDPKVDGQSVRVGWYQRDYSEIDDGATSLPDYWDMQSWYLGSGKLDSHTGTKAAIQDRPWRGLTEPNEDKQ